MTDLCPNQPPSVRQPTKALPPPLNMPAGVSAGGAQLSPSEELAAEILQPADAGHRGIDAAPADAGPIQHSPDQ
jgi:hypothetical protein